MLQTLEGPKFGLKAQPMPALGMELVITGYILFTEPAELQTLA